MPRTLCLAVFCAIFVGCSGEKTEDPPAQSDSPEARKAALQTDIQQAASLLEEKKYAEFFERYMPARTLQGKPKDVNLETAVQGIQAQYPEFFPEMLEMLQGLNPDSIEFLNEDNTHAGVHVKDGAVLSPHKSSLSDPAEEEVPNVKGFPGEPGEVLAQAIAVLEAGNHQEFIEKMYPRGELLSATSEVGKRELADRLKEHPEMAAQMLADLKAMQELTPVVNDEETLATYELTAEKLPTRKIQLEKQGEWRLANNSQRIRGEMYRQSQLKNVASRNRDGVEWEWAEDHWRLAN